jgi:hypothetical protein
VLHLLLTEAERCFFEVEVGTPQGLKSRDAADSAGWAQVTIALATALLEISVLSSRSSGAENRQRGVELREQQTCVDCGLRGYVRRRSAHRSRPGPDLRSFGRGGWRQSILATEYRGVAPGLRGGWRSHCRQKPLGMEDMLRRRSPQPREPKSEGVSLPRGRKSEGVAPGLCGGWRSHTFVLFIEG